MFDLLKSIFALGFVDLQEAFYFYAICFIFCKFAKLLYKVFMRIKLVKDGKRD